ncbi:hypothetical protein FRC09_006843 [Ceratobasidium sp. 395]|nr:hypothetical protein FRC09_006843 [Ceratobasidium sp. 395]
MKREHPKWGPDLDRYPKIFDDRVEKALENYMTSQEITSVAHDGLMPLSVLETMLIVGEKILVTAYQHGENSLPIFVATIRRYTELTETGIFKYYYGYLCMRHIVHMVCIGTLIECKMLDDFLSSFDPSLNSLDVSWILAEEALEQMTRALLNNGPTQTSICLGCTPPNGDAFTHVGGLSYDDVEFLVMTLWKDRRSIIVLGDYMMLPGFSALLFTLCQMTIFSKAPNSTKKWAQLQDMILRFYTVASNIERQVMRELALVLHKEMMKHELVYDHTTDEEDARNVVQAYNNMFRSSSSDELAPIMRLDISNLLSRFVSRMITPNLVDCISMVAWSELERLWLEFDQERNGFMAAYWHGFTRRNMRPRLNTLENEKEFASMLLESDVLGLVGRVILLLSREESQPEEWDYLLGGFEGLRGAMAGSTPVDEQLAHANITDWIKVKEQLDMLHMKMVPIRVPERYFLEAIEVWDACGPAPTQEILWWMCSNPRCATVKAHMKPPGAKSACGRCLEAVYCDKRCQLMCVY